MIKLFYHWDKGSGVKGLYRLEAKFWRTRKHSLVINFLLFQILETTSHWSNSRYNGSLSQLVYTSCAHSQLDVPMLPHLVKKFRNELCKDLSRQLCTWWIQMSIWKDWNIFTWVAWNHVKLLTACSALCSAAKAWERQKIKLQLASLGFPWRERSIIRMTLKRQVCISFWSVTSFGEVYVPSKRISFRQIGGMFKASKGGILFWLQQHT